VKKILYPFLKLKGSTSPVPLRERPSSLQPIPILRFRKNNLSLSRLKAKEDKDFDTIKIYSSITDRCFPGICSDRTTARSYRYSDCKVNHRFFTSTLYEPKIAHSSLTTGSLKHRASCLSDENDLTLTHVLENQFLMNYTYIWWERGYPLFLQLLGKKCDSSLKGIVFDLVKMRSLG
jgi:hypothetical protein